jgi:hypothetical protein
MIQAFEDMVLKEKGDESYFQYFMSFTYFQSLGVVAGNILHIHPHPRAANADPPALTDLKTIGKPTYSTSGVRSLKSMVTELDQYNVPGYRLVAHISSPDG